MFIARAHHLASSNPILGAIWIQNSTKNYSTMGNNEKKTETPFFYNQDTPTFKNLFERRSTVNISNEIRNSSPSQSLK